MSRAVSGPPVLAAKDPPMTRAVTGYRSLLRTPGAAAFFVTAAVGRIGIAMTGLGLVWLLHARTGSYAAAGLATAGFALAEALIGPQLARLIDRFGQTRVLPFYLVATAPPSSASLRPPLRPRRSSPLLAPARPSRSSVPCPRHAGRICCAASEPMNYPAPSPWNRWPTRPPSSSGPSWSPPWALSATRHWPALSPRP